MTDILCPKCGPILDEELWDADTCPKCGCSDTEPLVHAYAREVNKAGCVTLSQAERLHLLIEHSARLIQAATRVLAEGYTDDASEQLTRTLGRSMVPRRMMWLRGDYDWDVSCRHQNDGYEADLKRLRHNTFTYGELRNG